jgi:hypothetical protein
LLPNPEEMQTGMLFDPPAAAESLPGCAGLNNKRVPVKAIFLPPATAAPGPLTTLSKSTSNNRQPTVDSRVALSRQAGQPSWRSGVVRAGYNATAADISIAEYPVPHGGFQHAGSAQDRYHGRSNSVGHQALERFKEAKGIIDWSLYRPRAPTVLTTETECLLE